MVVEVVVVGNMDIEYYCRNHRASVTFSKSFLTLRLLSPNEKKYYMGVRRKLDPIKIRHLRVPALFANSANFMIGQCSVDIYKQGSGMLDKICICSGK